MLCRIHQHIYISDIEIVEMRLKDPVRACFLRSDARSGSGGEKTMLQRPRTPFVSITMETLPALSPISSFSLCFAGLSIFSRSSLSSLSLFPPLFLFLSPPPAYFVLVTLWWNSSACLYAVSSRATWYNATPGCIVDQLLIRQPSDVNDTTTTVPWYTYNRSYLERCFFHLMSWELHVTRCTPQSPSFDRLMISGIALRNITIYRKNKIFLCKDVSMFCKNVYYEQIRQVKLFYLIQL